MKRLEMDMQPGAGKPLVLVVLVVASLILTTLWYREGDNGPLHLVRRGLLVVSQPFAVAGSAVFAPVRAVGTYVSESTASREEIASLKKQNRDLKMRLAELEEAELENKRLKSLVAFADAQDFATLGAHVIGRPTASWDHSIIIDRGSTDDVQVGTPVVASGGLVGQVVDVSPFNAKVRLITDSESGVAVIVQRTRAEGVVRGSVDGKLTLEFVGKENMPLVGDVLVTSGMGGVFPKGIVVGEVVSVAAPQADLFPKVQVRSRVDVTRIEDALVLTGSAGSQQSGGGE